MRDTKIEWCDHTFNPWVGCTKVSPGCNHCYAESWAKRSGHPELWLGERRRTTTSNWRQPLRWNSAGLIDGRRARVFCASLADVFDNQVPPSWRIDLWAMITATPNLDWLLLTKRPQNIARMLPFPWGNGWPNVWLGTTVENQDEERRISALAKVPAVVRFLSCEPLLGEVFIEPRLRASIDWVIVGGESGPRRMNIAWAWSLMAQCLTSHTAFFMKQMGGRSRPFPAIPFGLDWRQFPEPRIEGAMS